jgi:hypothetical protein
MSHFSQVAASTILNVTHREPGALCCSVGPAISTLARKEISQVIHHHWESRSIFACDGSCPTPLQ